MTSSNLASIIECLKVKCLSDSTLAAVPAISSLLNIIVSRYEKMISASYDELKALLMICHEASNSIICKNLLEVLERKRKSIFEAS
jgi:hypothetical protein